MDLLIKTPTILSIIVFIYSCSSDVSKPYHTMCTGDIEKLITSKIKADADGCHIFISQKYCSCNNEQIVQINNCIKRYHKNVYVYIDTLNLPEYYTGGLDTPATVLHTTRKEFEKNGITFYDPFYVERKQHTILLCQGF